ncbi:MAG: NUDIX hydrolase [Candidatus Nucleicultricaceae bacterium]
MLQERFKPFGVVNLLLRRNDEILLAQRINQGWEDGNYGLISGHLEGSETATEAIIREAKEELNITLLLEHLNVVHVMHRYSNRENIDITFECRTWRGSLSNMEPLKCGDLAFFPHWRLPANIISFVPYLLDQLKKGKTYSEFGFDLVKQTNTIFF